jgi:hypothetical protein
LKSAARARGGAAHNLHGESAAALGRKCFGIGPIFFLLSSKLKGERAKTEDKSNVSIRFQIHDLICA